MIKSKEYLCRERSLALRDFCRVQKPLSSRLLRCLKEHKCRQAGHQLLMKTSKQRPDGHTLKGKIFNYMNTYTSSMYIMKFLQHFSNLRYSIKANVISISLPKVFLPSNLGFEVRIAVQYIKIFFLQKEYYINQ